MTWFQLLKKWKETLDVLQQQNISDVSEKLDAKVVFQDTKKSLEALKQNIFSSSDQVKKQEQEHHVFQYIDRLLWFSVLSEHDKTFLNQLKQNILSKNSLQETDLESIITIVSHLEQKAENLNEVDQEKVKELHDTLSQHKTSLDLLKKGVAAVAPTLEEAKKKAFETMKKDLEKHRWSSWLAQPVYDYLMDKHVHKKSVSKFKEFLIGTVGLTVVGWFVGKDIKNLIANIDTLNVDQILESDAVSNAVENVENYTDQQIENAKHKFENYLQVFIKKNTGKDLTSEQMNRVMNKLNVWEAFRDSSSEMQDVLKYFINHDPNAADANIASAWLKILSFPLTFSAKIFSVLKEEGIIWYEDIGMTVVNGMVEYGLKWFQLFWSWLWWVMGKIPFDQIWDKMKSIYDKNQETANYLIFALMYRSTNSILFKAISNTTAYVAKMALWPLVELGDDIQSLKITQDGYKANIDQTMKQLKKIQKVLLPAWADLIGQYSKSFDDAIRSLEESNNVSKLLISLQDGPDLIDDLKRSYRTQYWVDLPDSILKEIVDKNWKVILSKKSDIFKKAVAKNVRGAVSWLKWNISHKTFLDKAKLVFGSSPIQSLQKAQVMEDLSKRLDDVSYYFWNVVSNKWTFLKKSILGWFKSRVNMVNAWMNLAEDADRMVFAFDTIDDMKKFVDYSKSIAKSTPEALKFLIGKSPIFLISGMTIAKDGTIPEKMKELGTGLLWLVPLIGPVILIGDSMKVSDINWTQAGIGGALLVTDAIYWIKAVNKIWFSKALVRGISKPIIDVAEILKAGYTSWATIVKRTKWAATIIKSEWLLWFSKSFFAEILTLRRAAKLWVVAALLYGWYCGLEYILDNVKDKEIHDMIIKYKDNQQELNVYLQEQWPSYDKETKSSILAYSTWAQLGISPDKIKDIEVNYDRNTSKYTIKLPVVYGRDYLIPIKENLENTLHIVEKSSSIDFTISWTAQVDYEKSLEEQGYSKDQIKNQYLALWY